MLPRLAIGLAAAYGALPEPPFVCDNTQCRVEPRNASAAPICAAGYYTCASCCDEDADCNCDGHGGDAYDHAWRTPKCPEGYYECGDCCDRDADCACDDQCERFRYNATATSLATAFHDRYPGGFQEDQNGIWSSESYDTITQWYCDSIWDRGIGAGAWQNATKFVVRRWMERWPWLWILLPLCSAGIVSFSHFATTTFDSPLIAVASTPIFIAFLGGAAPAGLAGLWWVVTTSNPNQLLYQDISCKFGWLASIATPFGNLVPSQPAAAALCTHSALATRARAKFGTIREAGSLQPPSTGAGSKQEPSLAGARRGHTSQGSMRRALRCLLLLATVHAARCKVALITGANGGIGAELVVQFARAGYDVVAACRSKSAHVHQLVATASVANKVKVLLGLDVTSPEKVNAFVDGLKRQRTSVDILVHAAGVATWQLSSVVYPGTTEPMALESLDYGLVAQAFEINAIGPLRLTETCLKQGLLGTGAKIAFVSSKLGSIASNCVGIKILRHASNTQLGANYAYRMSKSALNAAGRSLAVDLRPRGMTVVLLHPGYVATPMTGDRGDVVAAVSAAGLFRRVIALNASASGSFIDYDGRQVPW